MIIKRGTDFCDCLNWSKNEIIYNLFILLNIYPNVLNMLKCLIIIENTNKKHKNYFCFVFMVLIVPWFYRYEWPHNLLFVFLYIVFCYTTHHHCKASLSESPIRKCTWDWRRHRKAGELPTAGWMMREWNRGLFMQKSWSAYNYINTSYHILFIWNKFKKKFSLNWRKLAEKLKCFFLHGIVHFKYSL